MLSNRCGILHSHQVFSVICKVSSHRYRLVNYRIFNGTQIGIFNLRTTNKWRWRNGQSWICRDSGSFQSSASRVESSTLVQKQHRAAYLLKFVLENTLKLDNLQFQAYINYSRLSSRLIHHEDRCSTPVSFFLKLFRANLIIFPRKITDCARKICRVCVQFRLLHIFKSVFLY